MWFQVSLILMKHGFQEECFTFSSGIPKLRFFYVIEYHFIFCCLASLPAKPGPFILFRKLVCIPSEKKYTTFTVLNNYPPEPSRPIHFSAVTSEPN